MKDNVAIEVKDLSCKFGDFYALKDINSKIKHDKFYTIVGPNGSGKTTLLKHMAKLLNVGKSKIYIYGEDLTFIKTKELGTKISTVPQNTMIDFSFSAWDIVLMGRNPHVSSLKGESKEDIEYAKEAMVKTNTYYLKDKDITTLSGGERQRVIIARALAQKASIMLLDEPVSALDIQHQVCIMDLLKNLVKTEHITVIAVMHDLNLSAQYSDEMILMNKGNIIKTGPPKEVVEEETLKSIYNMNFYIMKNPLDGSPLILPQNSKKI